MTHQTQISTLDSELVAPNTGATESTSSLLSSLRLPDSYNNLGGITVPLKATYGKLNKHRFCRVHPGSDYKFRCLIVEDKASGETYLATPNMAPHLGNLAVAKTIRLTVDNAGAPRLIGEPDIDPTGRRNLWHTSLAEAIRRGETTWVRVQSNMEAGQYQIIEAANHLGQPQWPTLSMEALVNDAFSGKIIDSPNHPDIRQIQGRI